MTTSPAFSAELREVVAQRLAHVHQRIAALGRDGVRILAVTKSFPSEYVDVAGSCGLHAVGENYAAELAQKRARSTVPVRWHFLGRLQTNKIALVARHADLLGAVARAREISMIARQPVVREIDIEVDVTTSPTRSGARANEVEGLMEVATSAGVVVRGLMTVAPVDASAAATCFSDLARLGAQVGLTELSMGMSDDYELALAAGATEIRLGRALFGTRER
jgi:PLP dependent protein